MWVWVGITLRLLSAMEKRVLAVIKRNRQTFFPVAHNTQSDCGARDRCPLSVLPFPVEQWEQILFTYRLSHTCCAYVASDKDQGQSSPLCLGQNMLLRVIFPVNAEMQLHFC